MGSVFKKTEISDKERNELLSIIFVKLAEKGELEDEVISEHPHLFKGWSKHFKGNAGSIVVNKGNLYRSNHDVTDVDDIEPSENPSKWTRIGGKKECQT